MNSPLGLRDRFIKRAIDMFMAGAALIVLAPLMLAIGLAVRLTSPGPALFRQERIGRFGQSFTIFKFRSMTADNDDSAHRALVLAELNAEGPGTSDGVFKLENDPRVTSFGALLRRTSLDELPQLYNVLLGNMSLVGPRPMIDWEVELIPQTQAATRSRVRPGLTGLWQVSGRNHLSTPEMLELDCQYVERLESEGLGVDTEILVASPNAVLQGGGAR